MKLPDSARISFSGAVDRGGDPLVPHSMAFSAAMMSLKVLLGLPHDTRPLGAHGMAWRADADYERFLAVSGEGFRFLFDAAEYFRHALPGGAGPVRDCFDLIGVPVELCAPRSMEGLDGGWASDEELAALVAKNLAGGYPALILGGASADRALLAVGYEDGGGNLVAWSFVPGEDMTNKSFAPEDCQYISRWQRGAAAAALVRGGPEPVPEGAQAQIFRRALARGASALRAADFYGKWIAGFAPGGEPKVIPEIWDLAERRAYMEGFFHHNPLLPQGLLPAADAGGQIHALMWQVHALWEGENRAESFGQIVKLLERCRALDTRMAEAIEGALEGA